MPRSIVLGNDRLHIGFDMGYVLRDLYFPHVGQENHLARGPSRTGIWSNGRFAWVDAPEWEREVNYVEDALVSQVRLFHPGWRLEVNLSDCVDLDRAVIVRRVEVRNHDRVEQDVRAFFHYALQISGTGIGDTVLFDPDLQAVLAYKGRRYFLANVMQGSEVGVKQWAAGIRDFNGMEGTWRDAEDGWLSGNAVAQGSVDTTIGAWPGKVAPDGTATAYSWLAAGENRAQVQELDKLVRERGPEVFLQRTRDWWRAWVSKEPFDLAGLDEKAQSLYRRSLLTMRSMVDGDGAIIAASDSDIINFSRDTYAYCWPRDGALAAMAFSKAGYSEVSRKFYTFCLSVFDPFSGYFQHKYTPSGELASTWHPWVGPDGKRQLALQEDETGLVIYSLWKHYEVYRGIEFVKPMYRPLIRAGADFLCGYQDPATGLPMPSYDLWEERWGVHAYTAGAIWAGLDAASRFARTFNQQDISEQYRVAADRLKAATVAFFWDDVRGHFSRTLYPHPSGVVRDSTLDASVLALTLYGMLDPNDDRVRRTVSALQSRLWSGTRSGGMARYEDDPYQRDANSGYTGNPWFITTLWLGQYYAAAAMSPRDLEAAYALLKWGGEHAQPTGLMPEQISPESGAPLSVSPLMWSHAEYITAVHAYMAASRRLNHAQPLAFSA